MNSSTNSQNARRCVESIWAADWETVANTFGEEAVLIDPLLTEPVRGKAAILDLYKSCREYEPDMSGEIKSVTAEQDRVVIEWISYGTMAKPFPGMPASVVGKRVEIPEVNILEFRDGKIISNTVYADTGAIRRQLGLKTT